MRILVTSFEPFGGDPENASSLAAAELLGNWHGQHELVGEVLPVVFDDAHLRAAVAQHRPDLVVALGEAGGRRALTPERRAANEMRARIPDNAGAQPVGEILPGQADAEASVDVDALVARMRAAGWAAQVSDDAGRFVCNFVAYHAYRLPMPAVFVHVPALRSGGEATVGQETDDPAKPADSSPPVGREPRTPAEIAEALAAGLRGLR